MAPLGFCSPTSILSLCMFCIAMAPSSCFNIVSLSITLSLICSLPINLFYIATSNLYSAPSRIIECQERENNQTIPSQPDACIEPDNHSESIVALDLYTGKIKWYKQLGGYDLWFGACHRHLDPRCPPGPSPDADFGEAPMMLTTKINGTKKDIVVAVQKSGFAWALDRDTGSIVWSTVSFLVKLLD